MGNVVSLNLILPNRILSSAKILQTSGKKTCFQFPECSYIFCKDTPNCVHYKIMRFIFRAILTVCHAFCVVSRYAGCFVTE